MESAMPVAALMLLSTLPLAVESWTLRPPASNGAMIHVTQKIYRRHFGLGMAAIDDDGATTNGSSNGEPDLFEYFDPLLSPHAYPNGIDPETSPLSASKELESKEIKDTPAPSFGFRLQDELDEIISSGTDTNGSVSGVVSDFPSRGVTPEVFDPTISPHAYVNGTPDVVIGDENAPVDAYTSSAPSSRIGILLIDHGSRNSASNLRLHELAEIYQQQFFGSSSVSQQQTVVKAAHMEIAEPSIPDALQAMIEEHGEDGLDEIICHPFFLGPHGRHVSEDIPRIIETAIQDLDISIPITTTQPVGDEVNIIMQAVHTTIRKSSSKLI